MLWPHSLETEFLRHIIEESIRVWYAHTKARATLLKARLGPNSTMAWVLQELCLHQQAEREGIPRELLGQQPSRGGWPPRLPFSPLSSDVNSLTHSAHATHTALPFTCTRG